MMNKIKKNISTILIVFIAILAVSINIFVKRIEVSGHSMDPTLADKQKLITIKHIPLKRFDIVVAKEKVNNQDVFIIKRLIGLPGDTIEYKQDTLYVNGKKTDEPYLNKFKSKLADKSLDEYYANIDSKFSEVVDNTNYFTLDKNGNDSFKITLKNDEYYLLGDDRLISKDSRIVGPFSKSNIVSKTLSNEK